MINILATFFATVLSVAEVTYAKLADWLCTLLAFLHTGTGITTAFALAVFVLVFSGLRHQRH